MPKQIPLYSAGGQLTDWISPAQMERLEKLHLIQVVRHRKGHVSRCMFRRRPGDGRTARLADYIGTRYSFREHLENGHDVWALRRLGRGNELRAIFLQVLTDCLVTGPTAAVRQCPPQAGGMSNNTRSDSLNFPTAATVPSGRTTREQPQCI
jgi:hypothetical protein